MLIMTAVECPVCHLRFHARTELEWHGRNDHCHRHQAHPEQTGDRQADQPAPQRAGRAAPAHQPA
jgi:hypothetical protein